MAEGPNPQRKSNPWNPGKYLPKVFIAYPRKPTVYEQLRPPENAAGNHEVWRQFEDQVVRLESDAEAEVRAHEKRVKRFADFLQMQLIAVAYDQLLRDLDVANITRWCQTQIEDSDYLILVVTSSLCQFLNGKCPADKEPLFSSDYLYNVIHSRPNSHKIVPVFLFSAKNLSQVPTAFQASTIYEVWDEEYRHPFSEGLTSLLCRLTGQNRFQPPEPLPAPIPIAPIQRRRFMPGGAVTETAVTPPNLSQNYHSLDMKALSKLAEKSEFSRHWKSIAKHLGLSEAEIERCECSGGTDENEACLQMLKFCAQQHGGASLTVATLSEAITKSGHRFLLHILHTS